MIRKVRIFLAIRRAIARIAADLREQGSNLAWVSTSDHGTYYRDSQAFIAERAAKFEQYVYLMVLDRKVATAARIEFERKAVHVRGLASYHHAAKRRKADMAALQIA
jgi:hypothetical protein